MMEQHTHLPWKVSGTENVVAGGNYVVALDCRPDDARRIVACVNACAGFSNDELEGANLHKDSIEAQNEIDDLSADLATAEQDSRQKQARIDRLERERDALLAAFNNFMDSHEECTDFDGFTAQIVSMDDYHEAQEYISRMEGSAS